MILEFPFSFGERVSLDGGGVTGTVTAVTFRPPSALTESQLDSQAAYVLVEVAYVFNGESKASWIEAWRLSR